MSDVAVRYCGKMVEGTPDRFIAGVPPRDLERDEWDALTEDLKAACLASGLYEAGSLVVKPARSSARRGEGE